MSDYRPGRFSILPVIIKNLMIINGLIFLAMSTLPAEMQSWVFDNFALHNFGSDLFKPHQLVTHLFMHGSWWHVISNMITLWMFGSLLENYVGPKRFLIFYMVCGIGAALCYMAVNMYEYSQVQHQVDAFMSSPTYENLLELNRRFGLGVSGDYRIEGLVEALHRNPGDPNAVALAKLYVNNFGSNMLNVPLVGASGAVYGILFGAAYLFPNMMILYFFFPMRLKYAAAFMIVNEVVSAFQNNPGDNVAHFAHLGGVLISFLLIKNWKRRGLL